MASTPSSGGTEAPPPAAAAVAASFRPVSSSTTTPSMPSPTSSTTTYPSPESLAADADIASLLTHAQKANGHVAEEIAMFGTHYSNLPPLSEEEEDEARRIYNVERQIFRSERFREGHVEKDAFVVKLLLSVGSEELKRVGKRRTETEDRFGKALERLKAELACLSEECGVVGKHRTKFLRALPGLIAKDAIGSKASKGRPRRRGRGGPRGRKPRGRFASAMMSSTSTAPRPQRDHDVGAEEKAEIEGILTKVFGRACRKSRDGCISVGKGILTKVFGRKIGVGTPSRSSSRVALLNTEKYFKFLREEIAWKQKEYNRLVYMVSELRKSVSKLEARSAEHHGSAASLTLSKVDFDQLLIENSEMRRRLDGMNVEIVSLKKCIVRLKQELSRRQEKVAAFVKTNSSVSRRVDVKERQYRKLKKLIVMTQQSKMGEQHVNKKLLELHAEVSVPKTAAYIRVTRELNDLRKRILSWQRKNEISAASRKTKGHIVRKLRSFFLSRVERPATVGTIGSSRGGGGFDLLPQLSSSSRRKKRKRRTGTGHRSRASRYGVSAATSLYSTTSAVSYSTTRTE